MTQTEKLSQLAREGARKRSMNINDNDGKAGGREGVRQTREGVWGLKQIMVTPPHSRHSWKLLRSVQLECSTRLEWLVWSGLEVLWLYQRT